MKYSNDTTSFQGAVDNLPRSGTQRRRILDEIVHTGEYGITRDELEAGIGLNGNAVRPRVRELQEAGLIEETERTRRTRSGSQAAVLVVKNVGEGASAERERSGQTGYVSGGWDSSPSGTLSGVETLAPRLSPPGGAESPPASPYDPFEEWAA